MNLLRRLVPPGAKLEGLASSDMPHEAVEEALTAPRFAELESKPRALLSMASHDAVRSLKGRQQLRMLERAGIEAVIRTTGRPALLIKDGEVQVDNAEGKDWQFLGQPNDHLKRVISAVGRIDLAGIHVGTGFVIAPGRILTNRHVAEVIGKAFVRESGDVWLLKAGGATIDFDRESGTESSRVHRILRIVAAGPEAINMVVDLEHLDAAILEISEESVGPSPKAHPRPVPFMVPTTPLASDGGTIFSIGYPGWPRYEPKGQAPTTEDLEVMATLKRVFDSDYGVKRFSPGEILTRPGRLPDGGRGWAFTHDATTLGGASGSCVVRQSGSKFLVVGLHFGGAWLKQNFAHATSRLRDDFLALPKMEWTA